MNGIWLQLTLEIRSNPEFTVHESRSTLLWSVGINIIAKSKQIGITLVLSSVILYIRNPQYPHTSIRWSLCTCPRSSEPQLLLSIPNRRGWSISHPHYHFHENQNQHQHRMNPHTMTLPTWVYIYFQTCEEPLKHTGMPLLPASSFCASAN